MRWLVALLPGCLSLGLRARRAAFGLRDAGCRDNPDFLDAMGYPCDAWKGFDCSTAHETFGYIFTEEDEAALLVNCPVTCELCDATTTTTTTTLFVVTSTTTTTTTSTTTTSTTTTTTTTSTTTTTLEGQFAVDKGRGGIDPATGTRGRHMRNPQVGMRVVRGPKWTNFNKDGGIGVVGRVVEVDESVSPPRVRVVWPHGAPEGEWYQLGQSQLSESEAKDHLLFEPLGRDNLVLGARVRRGRNWRGGDEDGGMPGEIVRAKDDDVTVTWPNGVTKEYSIAAEELSIRVNAASAATEDILDSIWEEEAANARKVIAEEEAIIANATALAAAKDVTDEVKESAEREIAAAKHVIEEAEKVVKLAEDHLKEVDSLADASAGAGSLNATQQRKVINCENSAKDLERLLKELRQPAGSRFAVHASSADGRDRIHLPLTPLDPFGSNRSRAPLYPNKFGVASDRRFNHVKDPAAGSFDAQGMKYRAPFNDAEGFGDGEAGSVPAEGEADAPEGALVERAALLAPLCVVD